MANDFTNKLAFMLQVSANRLLISVAPNSLQAASSVSVYSSSSIHRLFQRALSSTDFIEKASAQASVTLHILILSATGTSGGPGAALLAYALDLAIQGGNHQIANYIRFNSVH